MGLRSKPTKREPIPRIDLVQSDWPEIASPFIDAWFRDRSVRPNTKYPFRSIEARAKYVLLLLQVAYWLEEALNKLYQERILDLGKFREILIRNKHDFKPVSTEHSIEMFHYWIKYLEKRRVQIEQHIIDCNLSNTLNNLPKVPAGSNSMFKFPRVALPSVPSPKKPKGPP